MRGDEDAVPGVGSDAGAASEFAPEAAGVVGEGSDVSSAPMEAKEKEAHPHLATEAIFHAYTQQFLSTDLVDRGRSLQSRSRLHGGMKTHLSPQESRHEIILRPMLTMIASLTNRVRYLEEKQGVDWQSVKDAEDEEARQRTAAATQEQVQARSDSGAGVGPESDTPEGDGERTAGGGSDGGAPQG